MLAYLVFCPSLHTFENWILKWHFLQVIAWLHILREIYFNSSMTEWLAFVERLKKRLLSCLENQFEFFFITANRITSLKRLSRIQWLSDEFDAAQVFCLTTVYIERWNVKNVFRFQNLFRTEHYVQFYMSVEMPFVEKNTT